MKKRVLLLGGNYLPEPTGIGKYNGEMIEWLSKNGYDCTVVTSYPYYPYWKIQNPYEKKSFWFHKEIYSTSDSSIKVHRCPHYVPNNPSGAKRIASDFSLCISFIFQIFRFLFRKKFDIIIAVAPPFQIGLLGLLFSKLRGGKLVYHIQDLQVDAAKDLKMIKSRFLLKVMFDIEKLILRNADFVSSISQGMMDLIYKKHNRPVIFFPNWVDVETFYPKSPDTKLRESFSVKPDEKLILYSGAIGEKQGLEIILQVAKEMISEKVKFVICGSGPYKEKLKLQSHKLKLSNIIFLPLQPKDSFNEFLNAADLHLILQKENASDLVMPSKLSTILAVGGLVLATAKKASTLYNIISANDMGIVLHSKIEESIISSIRSLIKTDYLNQKANARKFAINYLSIDSVMSKFTFEVFNHKKEFSTKSPIELHAQKNVPSLTNDQKNLIESEAPVS